MNEGEIRDADVHSELGEQGRDLAAVVRLVIEEVGDHGPKWPRLCPALSTGPGEIEQEIGCSECGGEVLDLSIDELASFTEGMEVLGHLRRVQTSWDGAPLEPREPDLVCPQDVVQGAPNRSEEGAAIGASLRVTQ